MEELTKIYNKYYKEYKDQLFGAFILGNKNYGLGDEYSICVVTIPTFNDLCFQKPLTDEYDNITVLDIRLFYNAFTQHPIIHACSALELLFTNYFIINPKYNSLYNNLLNDRELIARGSMEQRIACITERFNDAYDFDDMFEAARLHMTLELFIGGSLAEDCFHIKDKYRLSYLQNIKNGSLKLDLENTKEEFNEMIAGVDMSCSTDGVSALKQHILSIIEHSLETNVDIETFYNCLTDNEKTAYENICEHLVNKEGNISISNLIKETNLSRPVYKNLFVKMEQNKVAEIINKGVKGTYIRLY